MILPTLKLVLADDGAPSVSPAPHTISLPQSADIDLPFEVVGSHGDPIDVSTWQEIRATLRKSDGSLLVALLANPPSSKKLVFTAAVTGAMAKGPIDADVFGKDAAGKKHRLLVPSMWEVSGSMYATTDPVTLPGGVLVGGPLPIYTLSTRPAPDAVGATSLIGVAVLVFDGVLNQLQISDGTTWRTVNLSEAP